MTAWPLVEAQNLLDRIGDTPPAKGYILFETGYGPSGLPHIGTFGEVARTTMVRHAFNTLCDIPTKLFAFSDDMDGLRGVPDNIPNPERLQPHFGKPLTSVPDPFDAYESFGAHNNARLRRFLDRFDFDYEFLSATECYRTGVFDNVLLRVLDYYDEIMALILPTLGKERRASFSPILPISPNSGKVLQVPLSDIDPESGRVAFRDETGEVTELPVTGGHCKLGWKADWAMRWVALDVDYEMSGKDLIDSVKLSSGICRILGAQPPVGFHYELFLDENGEKISKSRGNGLTIDEWLRYGSRESLSMFMYQSPRKAKRLYFDVIPRMVDDYAAHLEKFPGETEEEQRENPAWHIHGGEVPPPSQPLTFAVLLNLASACNAEDKTVLWGFITRYVPTATPSTSPMLDSLVGHAVAYYQDFVKPAKRYRSPDETERAALEDLAEVITSLPTEASAEDIQTEVYEVGKRHKFKSLRDWFRALYEVLLGQRQGPRMGSFIALYGRRETLSLIREALEGTLTNSAS